MDDVKHYGESSSVRVWAECNFALREKNWVEAKAAKKKVEVHHFRIFIYEKVGNGIPTTGLEPSISRSDSHVLKKNPVPLSVLELNANRTHSVLIHTC